MDSSPEVQAILGLKAAAGALVDAEMAVLSRVRRCRENGEPWEMIGAALGISRQAAWERYSHEVNMS